MFNLISNLIENKATETRNNGTTVVVTDVKMNRRNILAIEEYAKANSSKSSEYGKKVNGFVYVLSGRLFGLTLTIKANNTVSILYDDYVPYAAMENDAEALWLEFMGC